MDSTSTVGPFDDRLDAGRHLAGALQSYAGTSAVVVGLARGGVEVGAAVAAALRLPLRALVVRKIGAPRNPELAIGAVSETGVQWTDARLMKPTGASDRYLEQTVAAEAAEAKRQHLKYAAHDSRESQGLRGRVAILVDDGIATGATALVAIRTARDLGASRIVLATPVASAQATSTLGQYADEVIVLVTPEAFQAVGLHYRQFAQLDDEVVMRRLEESSAGTLSTAPLTERIDRSEIHISAGPVMLPAILSVPTHTVGIVIFAHGSGSGRLSPRNGTVAQMLNESGLATLLADLLTDDEARDRRKVFDIGLLAGRVLDCATCVDRNPITAHLPLGLFGASTGAGAALLAASDHSARIRAIVSRGGRPDLAAGALEEVEAPTLLLVGSADTKVIALNRHAFDRLHSEKSLIVIPGAGHLFEEPGALDEVAREARDWFLRYVPI
jgi:putative phosphoribosyl transferase